MVAEGSFGMGRRMEILDIEMVGIKKGIERGLRECEREGARIVTIRVDSLHAIWYVKDRIRTAGKPMAHTIIW